MTEQVKQKGVNWRRLLWCVPAFIVILILIEFAVRFSQGSPAVRVSIARLLWIAGPVLLIGISIAFAAGARGVRLARAVRQNMPDALILNGRTNDSVRSFVSAAAVRASSLAGSMSREFALAAASQNISLWTWAEPIQKALELRWSEVERASVGQVEVGPVKNPAIVITLVDGRQFSFSVAPSDRIVAGLLSKQKLATICERLEELRSQRGLED